MSAETEIKAEQEGNNDKAEKVEEKTEKEENKDVQMKDEKPVVNKNEDLDKESKLKKIGDRILFFFSNANLRSDRYMKNQMKSRKDHTIEIKNLLRFKTIQTITQSSDEIAEAAEKYASDLVRLNESRDAIGRKDEFDFNIDVAKINALTLFVDNLPIIQEGDRTKYDTKIPDIVSFFKRFGKVTLVRLRYDKGTKKAAGSAFVEFDTEENMQKALAANDEPLKMKTFELKLQSMVSWIEAKEKKTDSNKKRSRDEMDDNGNNGNKENEDYSNSNGEVEIPEVKIEWKEGCVISMKGIPDGCDRETILEAIKETCEKYDMDTSPYVDYSRGQTDGAIRFKEPYEKISELIDLFNKGDIKICGSKVESVQLLAGEEEKSYWKAFEEFKRKKLIQIAMRNNNKKRKGNVGGRGKGRYGKFGRGRGGGRR